jgi:hypothetical protein
VKTIFKYAINPGIQELALPVGAQILTVQEQQGKPQLWALVDTEAPTEARAFAVVGTGHPVPEPVGDYIGTFQLPMLGLVFHLFAEPPKETRES